MGDHPEWPPTPRAMYAGTRCLAYLMVAVAGLDVAFGPLGTTGERTAHLFVDIIGIMAAASGAAGTVGTIYRRWMVEWVAVSVMTGVLFVYTVLDWYVMLFIIGYPPLPIGIVGIGGGIAVAAAVATGRHRWRLAALAAAASVLLVAVPLNASNTAIITAVTAMAAGRMIELWLFSDAAVRARRSRPGAVPEFEP